jgi:heat shock protein HtpX
MWQQIRYNQTRTVMLIIGIGVLLIVPCSVLGAILVGAIIPLLIALLKDITPAIFGIGILVLYSIIWISVILFAYSKGDDMLISLVGAKKITTGDLHRLLNIVEEMKIASGLETVPSIYIIDDPAMNAFALGCRPDKAAIIVTSGLLAKLNRDELQGVIAHEMAHIKNRDVLLMGLCVSLFQIITTMSWCMIPLIENKNFFLGRGRWVVVLITFLVAAFFALIQLPAGYSDLDDFLRVAWMSYFLGFILLMPLIAQLTCNAFARRREYLADACSALYTRYPEGLASALQKIATSTEQLKSANMTTAALYIINPFREKGMAASDSTETHPPISERIRILRAMAHASYAEYDRAYREIRGIDTGIIPKYATAISGPLAIRESIPDELDHIQRVRETSNLIWNVNNYKTINCDCGTKMRLPPGFKLAEVRCPHCGKIIPVTP